MRAPLGSSAGLVACVVAWVLVAAAPAAAEQLGSSPIGNYVTNGRVLAEATSAGSVYLGGNFTQVGPRTGPAAAIATASAQAVTPVPQVSGRGEEVDATLPDGSGGWYIGGSFTHVGGVSRSNLAHIGADGSVDPSFAPEPTGKVFALAMSADGTRLYVGGAFAQISGQSQSYLAELSPVSGAPIAGFSAQPNNVVLKLLAAPSGNVYAAGAFTAIGGQSRPYLAELSGQTGAAVAGFAPAPNGGVLALAISPDASHLYVGGSFTAIGGGGQTNLAELDAGSGQAVASFAPAVDGAVFALAVAPDGSTIYAGGAFFDIGGTTAFHLAALDANGGLVSGFAGSADKPVFALALAGGRLYVGGDFDTADSAAVPNLAAVDPGTGSLVTAFKPGVNGTVLSLAPSADAGTLFTGGAFTSVGATLTNGLAALRPSDDTPIATFNGHLGGFSSPVVSALALSPDGSRLYVGGTFDTVNSVSTGDLVALNPTTGARIAAFAPNCDSSVLALAVSSDNSAVYAGGDFGSLGGQSQSYLGAVRSSDGQALPGFVASVPAPVNALALDSAGGRLYAGGGSSPLFGLADGFLAGVSPATGAPLAGFGAAPDHVVDTLMLSPDAQTLYVGGAFTNLSGQPDLGVGAVNAATGAPQPGFAPRSNGAAFTFSIAPDGSALYAGGTFTSIGGQRVSHLAALNPSTGSALPFDPEPNDVVTSLARSADGTQLYAGGAFRGFDLVAQQGFAAFGPGPPAAFGGGGGGGGAGGAGHPPRVRLLERRLPRTRLVHHRVRVDTGVTAECPVGGAVCVTTLHAYRVVRRRVRRHRHRVTVIRFIAANHVVTHTAPGKRSELVFTLSKANTSRLAKARRLDIDLRLRATEGAASPATFETDLFIKAPHGLKAKTKKKHRKGKPKKR
jgi:WD40 repeat protein